MGGAPGSNPGPVALSHDFHIVAFLFPDPTLQSPMRLIFACRAPTSVPLISVNGQIIKSV